MTGEAERLNKGCICVTLDRDALAAAFDREVGAGFTQGLERSHPLLFADVSVFVPEAVLAAMTRVVAAVEASARLPGYRQVALGRASPLADRDHGPAGALMGYDFHLATDGPKLIEINTNAGGAFLTAPLARAQRACCASATPWAPSERDFAADIVRMFGAEWTRQRGGGRPRRIAILDDNPDTQYLLPEFLLAQALLRDHGFDVLIGDPIDVTAQGDTVLLQGLQVDLIYNRLVDFALDDPRHVVLREAYEADRVVVTPNPHVHALFADKRNLALLCDNERMRMWGLEPPHLEALDAATLLTLLVTASNAEQLWADRKAWFFKPANGHASKAAYRGDKLTRRVWGEILAGDYVAQAYAAPGLRNVRHDGERAELKADVRLYTYDGRVLLSAARLYRGQTTNMRTPGGGFAPVLILRET